MSATATPLAVLRRPWRRSRWLVLIELALVAAIFDADARHWIPLSKTPVLLILGWISLRIRGLRWRDAGLARPANWLRSLALGIGAGVLMEAIELLVTQPLLIHLTGKQPDFSDFRPVIGNPKLLAIGLALTWTLAAFGEEMVWRGYLMNRVAGLLRRPRIAWMISLIAVNAAFGYAHSYQGITGIIDEALMGMILGLVYLLSNRNLFPAIIAHGVADSIDLALIFFGHYPGM